MNPIILASSSPRRKALLQQIKIPFTIISSNIEENIEAYKCSPASAAEQLSLLKAEDIAKKINKGIVIGADTIVVIDNHILGKPKNDSEAFEMLTKLSGREHEVITGVSVIDVEKNIKLVEHESTIVKFRTLNSHMIRRYIDSKEPKDKAGSYGIQGLGALLVERIEGCYYNVVGLPLTRLSKMLEKIDIHIV